MTLWPPPQGYARAVNLALRLICRLRTETKAGSLANLRFLLEQSVRIDCNTLKCNEFI